MGEPLERGWVAGYVLLWAARLSALAAIVPLMLIVFGEWGTGPAGARGWIYLALFPFGFAAGYLAGWRRPLAGGSFSLACMIASLAVINRTLGWGPYLTWGVLSVPGVLFVIAGWMLRDRSRSPS